MNAVDDIIRTLKAKSRHIMNTHRVGLTEGCCLLTLATGVKCFLRLSVCDQTALLCLARGLHRLSTSFQKHTPLFCSLLLTLLVSVIYSFPLRPAPLSLPYLFVPVLLLCRCVLFAMTFPACNPMVNLWDRGPRKHSYSCHVETYQKLGSHPQFKKHMPAVWDTKQ